MSLNVELTHERTLGGAVDSYLKELVHVRPFLLQRYADILEGLSERWLDEIGINELETINAAWIATYIAQANDQQLARTALHDFYRWALQKELIAENPLSSL